MTLQKTPETVPELQAAIKAKVPVSVLYVCDVCAISSPFICDSRDARQNKQINKVADACMPGEEGGEKSVA